MSACAGGFCPSKARQTAEWLAEVIHILPLVSSRPGQPIRASSGVSELASSLSFYRSRRDGTLSASGLFLRSLSAVAFYGLSVVLG
jgi:hypothetical protein